jgi:ribosomal protein S18 acetylase RimI-like enzyme
MGVHLRTLDTTDAPVLAEYLRLSIFVRPGDPPPPPDIIEQPPIALYVDGWGRYGDEGVMAIDVGSGCDVGAAWLRLWPGPETGYGYVDRATPELAIAVRPEHRGRGIGTCLLDALIDRASVRHRGLSLSVSPDNPAVRLYERFGFAVASAAGGSLTMWRRLGPAR